MSTKASGDVPPRDVHRVIAIIIYRSDSRGLQEPRKVADDALKRAERTADTKLGIAMLATIRLTASTTTNSIMVNPCSVERRLWDIFVIVICDQSLLRIDAFHCPSNLQTARAARLRSSMTISQVCCVCSYRTKVLFCLNYEDLSLHSVVNANAVRVDSDPEWNNRESPALWLQNVARE